MPLSKQEIEELAAVLETGGLSIPGANPGLSSQIVALSFDHSTICEQSFKTQSRTSRAAVPGCVLSRGPAKSGPQTLRKHRDASTEVFFKLSHA